MGMCGRYALLTAPEIIAALLHLNTIGEALKKSRYNIAPTQSIPVVRCKAAGQRELVSMYWGLIPKWAKERSIASKLINARSETAAEKPAFREALKSRRCIIPASGFYEWKKVGTKKQPYFISRADGQPLLFAGLWEEWIEKSTGSLLESCTILTTSANGMLKDLHGRMPVVLDANDVDRWFDPALSDATQLQAMMKPAAEDCLVMHPVSTKVNASRIDEPSLIERVDPLSPVPTKEIRAADDDERGLFG